MSVKTRVLIADDHTIVASGVKAILDSSNEYNTLGVVADGVEALDFVEKNKVDIVLMDINMPNMNGIECTRKLKEKWPDIKVIILTMYNRKQFIRELLDVGADGCVLKNNSGTELILAIERVQSGKTYFDQLNDFVDAPKELKEFKLGEREIEIIELIAEGETSKEIAARLYISEHTVKTHRKNIFRKVGVNDADALVNWAMNQKLI